MNCFSLLQQRVDAPVRAVGVHDPDALGARLLDGRGHGLNK